MPSYLGGARSRVAKPQVKRTSSLPFTATKRTDLLHRAHTIAVDALDDGETVVNKETAVVHGSPGPANDRNIKDVISAITYAQTLMFDRLPERAGFNSVRTAEVLNFQKHLPPIVSLAHIHALRPAASQTERELSTLLSSNNVRRIQIMRRGNDVSGFKEFLIKTQDYEDLLRASDLSDEIVSSYLAVLKSHPRSHTLTTDLISRKYADRLLRAGFLVLPQMGVVKTGTGATTHQLMTANIVTHEWVGGMGDGHEASASVSSGRIDYVLSAPGIGAYLKLIEEARTYFLDLLRKFSIHRQAPAYLLKERWNGNVDDDTNQASLARRLRGEFANVLPAKTRKWKSFKGLNFDWVMEECLGAGLIELFETNSVGLGVRSLV